MSKQQELDVAERDVGAHQSIARVHRRGEDTTETIVRSLHARLDGRFDVEMLRAQVEAEFTSFADVRITQFVPIFVERRVEERLSRLGSSCQNPARTVRS